VKRFTSITVGAVNNLGKKNLRHERA